MELGKVPLQEREVVTKGEMVKCQNIKWSMVSW